MHHKMDAQWELWASCQARGQAYEHATPIMLVLYESTMPILNDPIVGESIELEEVGNWKIKRWIPPLFAKI